MHLRPCLLCFDMYPEDYELECTRLAGIWIAEGFVWGTRGKTALQIGEECLNELCNRFLILKDEYEVLTGIISTHKVHDAVREMLIKIATEESFYSIHHRDKPMSGKLSHRVIIIENMPQEIIENNNSSRLRTLAVVGTKTVPPILEANLHKFQRLRMLHLQLASPSNTVESVAFSKWLKGIGSLHHLVYLVLQKVGAITTLPDSIGNLRNLQWLTIIHCWNLKSLPSSITRLEKLTVLRVVGCDSIECWPKGIGNLPNLEHFQRVKFYSEYVPNSWMSLSDFKQSKRLSRLFMDISNEEQVGDEECKVMQIPELLQLLWLSFHRGISLANAARIARKIDRPLCHPLQRLQHLSIYEYPGESMPAWLSPASLPNLRYLAIGGGRIKNLGPGFFFEWKVETLVLVGLEELEEDWENIERVMPFLKRADVDFCPKLNVTSKKYVRGN
ncbi:hypothetical protein ACLOJK_019555 [Asimina triloba]